MTAKQSFVDLGCGNGLLVHILSSEGVKHGSWPFLVSSLESVFKSSPRFIEIFFSWYDLDSESSWLLA